MTELRHKHKIMSIEEFRLKCMFQLTFDKKEYFISKSKECRYITKFNKGKLKVSPFVDNTVGTRSRMVKMTKIWNKYHEGWLSFMFEDDDLAEKRFKSWCRNFFVQKWKDFRGPNYDADYYEIDY